MALIARAPRTIALLVGVLWAGLAVAGGGPETTLVVVNGDSPASLRIANAYVRMRHIPQSHVVWLHRVPSLDPIDLPTFRDKIWKPIREYMAANHLDNEIDTIAYSADFPYSVDIATDIRANKLPNNRYRGKTASLTGLTYFARRVAIGDLGYLGENRYFRRNLALRLMPPRPPTVAETALFEKAERAFKKKNYQTANEAYQTLLVGYPWSKQAWYDLARGLASVGRSGDAMDALAKAVEAGWSHSLTTRNDRYLKSLHRDPDFRALIERMQEDSGPFQPAHGFHSRYVWTGRALPQTTNTADSLDRYYLSTMLAYTGVRGNSVPEALDYLASAASSDGTHPQGTVYLMENTNIRSEVRERYFHTTVAALKRRGRRAEILNKRTRGQSGVLPRGKDDVIGAVVGFSRYDWGRSKSRLLPGAIAESLTSYGGHFRNRSQTKLTEFLRYGAAGSSGAVYEPYSFQVKFPVAYMHVHYADGSSLAEAFYQSIEAPYQLLVVGDPLARPFAYFAGLTLASPDPTQPWRGVVSVRIGIKAAARHPIGWIELWVDGRHIAGALPGEPIPWDTTSVEDGRHELRLVAVEASPVETRSFVRLWVTVSNSGRRVDIKQRQERVPYGEGVSLSGLAPGAREVEICQGKRILGSAPVIHGYWQVTVPSEPLGVGAVMLFARAMFADGASARSAPSEITIEEPPRIKAMPAGGAEGKGVKVLVRDTEGIEQEVEPKRLQRYLRTLAKHKKTVEYIRLEGSIRVGRPGFYQLVINGLGQLKVTVDKRVVVQRRLVSGDREDFIPLSLAGGRHSIFLELRPTGDPRLKAILGGDEIARDLMDKVPGKSGRAGRASTGGKRLSGGR